MHRKCAETPMMSASLPLPDLWMGVTAPVEREKSDTQKERHPDRLLSTPSFSQRKTEPSWLRERRICHHQTAKLPQVASQMPVPPQVARESQDLSVWTNSRA